MPIKKCEVCNLDFHVEQTSLNIGKGKYCSRPCFMKGRKKPKKIPCESCGILFEVYPHQIKKGNGKYCSQVCMGIARMTKIMKECLNCKSNFTAEPNQIKNGGGKYCSKNCAIQHRSTTRALKKFIANITILPSPNACWIWTGLKNKDGYGRLYAFGRDMGAHRYSYIAFRNEITGDLLACHTCDIPSCVNPSHLFLGTNMDNMADAISKGRIPSVVLDDDKIVRIIEESALIPVSVLAARYNVTTRHLRNIIKYNKHWPSVERIPRPLRHIAISS